MSLAPVGVVTGLAAEAQIGARLGRCRSGGGTSRGAAAAAAALRAEGATRLISFGLAGGLDPALRPGALIVPEAVEYRGRVHPTDPDLRARLGGATHALLAGVDAVIVSAADKRAWRARTGACAADMESGAVAEARVPFAVLRAVCDPGQRDLPPAALIALDDSGAIGLLRVLGSLARRPGQLPALLRLAADAAAARGALIRRVGDIELRGGLVA